MYNYLSIPILCTQHDTFTIGFYKLIIIEIIYFLFHYIYVKATDCHFTDPRFYKQNVSFTLKTNTCAR